MAEEISTADFINNLDVNKLPDNPAAHGMKAAQIKKNFFGPIYEGLKRLLKEIQQIDPSAGGGTETGDGCSCEITEERVQELIGEALKGISGGSGVNIVQETGTSETDVMSQKATTDAIKYSLPSFGTDPVDGSLIISGGNYNFTYFPSGGSGSSGGGVESLPLTKLTSDSFTLQEISSGVYGARLLIYSNTPTCVSEINNYYYCTNFASLVSGISYVNVSLNNSYVHSKTNVYAGYNLATEHPIPTGQTMQWGKNNTGYYLRPNFLEYYEANYYYNGDCDWYVELELNINMQQLIIKAYQCERIYQYLD